MDAFLRQAGAIRLHRFLPFVPRDEWHQRHRGGLDAGHGFDGRHDPFVQLERARRTIALQGRIDPEHQHVVCVEADIDLAEIVESAHQEPRAHEERQADRHLRDEKRLGGKSTG